jgi:hypothetical protein
MSNNSGKPKLLASQDALLTYHFGNVKPMGSDVV